MKGCAHTLGVRSELIKLDACIGEKVELDET